MSPSQLVGVQAAFGGRLGFPGTSWQGDSIGTGDSQEQGALVACEQLRLAVAGGGCAGLAEGTWAEPQHHLQPSGNRAADGLYDECDGDGDAQRGKGGAAAAATGLGSAVVNLTNGLAVPGGTKVMGPKSQPLQGVSLSLMLLTTAMAPRSKRT